MVAVRKSGGFPLGEHETLTALQALSLAEGLERSAATKDAKIMRQVPGSDQRQEIPVNLKLIMQGKGPDLAMRAEDILFVPVSGAKNAGMKALEAAIQVGTGVAIIPPLKSGFAPLREHQLPEVSIDPALITFPG